jgi:ketopantoate reductase
VGGSKAVIGAEKVILKDDFIKTVEQRYQRVKAEKARMIQEVNLLNDLLENC